MGIWKKGVVQNDTLWIKEKNVRDDVLFMFRICWDQMTFHK